jgi:hypothetical protein
MSVEVTALQPDSAGVIVKAEMVEPVDDSDDNDDVVAPTGSLIELAEFTENDDEVVVSSSPLEEDPLFIQQSEKLEHRFPFSYRLRSLILKGPSHQIRFTGSGLAQ